jgi:hypothetical protein
MAGYSARCFSSQTHDSMSRWLVGSSSSSSAGCTHALPQTAHHSRLFHTVLVLANHSIRRNKPPYSCMQPFACKNIQNPATSIALSLGLQPLRDLSLTLARALSQGGHLNKQGASKRHTHTPSSRQVACLLLEENLWSTPACQSKPCRCQPHSVGMYPQSSVMRRREKTFWNVPC